MFFGNLVNYGGNDIVISKIEDENDGRALEIGVFTIPPDLIARLEVNGIHTLGDLAQKTIDDLISMGMPATAIPTFQRMLRGVKLELKSTDKAMTASLSDVGGIDMNEMDYDKTGAGVSIEFNEESLKAIMPNGINTLTPVIINIVPVVNILPLLGLQEKLQSELEISKK